MRTLTLILAAVLLTSCKTPSSSAPETGRNPSSASPTLRYRDLEAIILKNGAKTVEDTLRLISKPYANHLSYQNLVYNSFSLQGASFTEPRVLVTGPHAEFVFTFNGGTHQAGGYAIETMEYDFETATFNFREIAFKAQMSPQDFEDLPKEDIAYEDKNVRISKANPQRCTQCHGESPGPIWETYFIWPGVYGSNDDLLTDAFNGANSMTHSANYFGVKEIRGHSQMRLIRLREGVRDVEVEGIRAYIAGKPKHPRYGILPMRPVDTAFVRWNAGEPLKKIDTTAAIRKHVSESKKFDNSNRFYQEGGRPNLELNNNFYRLTMHKLRSDLSRKPGGDRAIQILKWMAACNPVYERLITEDGPEFQGLATESFYRKSVTKGLKGLFSDVLQPRESTAILARAGSIQKFADRLLIEEFGAFAEKISRLEAIFGKNALELVVENLPVEVRPDLNFYKRRMKQLPRHAEIAAKGEGTEMIITTIWMAYIAKGWDIDLGQYATNLRRAPSFESGGLGFLLEPGEYPLDCEEAQENLRAAIRR